MEKGGDPIGFPPFHLVFAVYIFRKKKALPTGSHPALFFKIISEKEAVPAEELEKKH